MQRLIEKLVEEQLSERVFLKKYPLSSLVFAVDKNTLDSTTSLEIKNVKSGKPLIHNSESTEYNLSDTFDTIPLPSIDLALIEKADSEPSIAEASIARAVFLTKSCRNKKPVITLGRARDNDIVIEMPSISKHHAFFLQGPDSNWYICDTSSTNGTSVENVAIEPNEQRLLVDNARIIFGQTVQCSFFSASGLWNFVKYFEGMKTQHADFLNSPED